MQLKKENFITEIEGRQTALFKLSNKNGLYVALTNYGGKIVSICVPDRNGNMDDIVAGYESIDDYIKGNKYFGAIIGRYANRIANGEFRIANKEYKLSVNNGSNHLHGGDKSFSDVVWDAREENGKIILSYLSKDGEEGYPGNLDVQCSFWLNDDNELHIVYEATTDATTIINLTHHSFFNLKGHDKGNILNHDLKINSGKITSLNADIIPTGKFLPVHNTPFDFTDLHSIGDRISYNDEQLEIGRGYDHNYVLNKSEGTLPWVATLQESSSGRVMEVYSAAPGLQLYTGNWLDGTDIGKNGHAYGQRSLVCLEPQHFPDSPNHSHFPSTILKPGEKYSHHIMYKFYFQ